MDRAAAVLVVRDDFSMPGAAAAGPAGHEGRFFGLLRDNMPDAIVLDLRDADGAGIATLHKIRERSPVPVLVIGVPDEAAAARYRMAGAADYLPAPVDLLRLSERLRAIAAGETAAPPATPARHADVAFAGLTFRPDRNQVGDARGNSVRLTPAEGLALSALLGRPGQPIALGEIGKRVFGRGQPAADRAVAAILERLRRKLARLSHTAGGELIIQKPRLGYMLSAAGGATDRLPEPRTAV